MDRNAAALLEQASAYTRVLDGIGGDGRFADASSDGPIRLAPDHLLVQALAEASRLARLAEAERVKLAGEILRRSEIGDDTSLARRLGTTGPTDLVAQTAGLRRDDAASLVTLSKRVRSRETISGEPLPPERPHVAQALADGLVDRTVATAMVRAIHISERGLAPAEADRLERQIVGLARDGFTPDQIVGFCKKVPDYADPEGAEPREQRLNELASITERTLDNGLTRYRLDLDPLTAGFFAAALEANTAKNRFRIVDPDEPAPTDDEVDRRPLARRRVDALRLLARQALKTENGHVAGTAVTLLVHIDLAEFMTGIGGARLSGVEGTISAKTARCLAAEAQIIPVVLGGDSQPLDLGEARRFFSEAQRRAMAARDGGCAGPNCDAPLAWTQAAHVRPAGRGPTSIDNGILLCPRCHRLHDERGWQVRREHGGWWWTPPPWVDPTGRLRPGGPPGRVRSA